MGHSPVTLVSVVGGHAGVLRQMLRHYRSLGVQESIVHVHAETCESEARHVIERTVKNEGGAVGSVTVMPWHISVNTMLYSRARTRQPNDWFVVADQDEFQLYPDGLHEAIAYCDKHGYDFIEGAFVDRTTADGRLPAVHDSEPLWTQLPVGSMVSAVVGGACINKIVAAKGKVKLVHGQHFAVSGRGCPVSDIYVPVHHFKWTEGVRAALDKRLVNQAQYSLEARRLCHHLDLHDGVATGAPEILAAKCAPDYPHWPSIREWRSRSVYFSPDLAARGIGALEVPPAQ